MGIPGSTSLFFAGDGLEDTGYNIKRSTRFNSGDSAYLTRTWAQGNQTKWTISFWAKKSSLLFNQTILGTPTSTHVMRFGSGTVDNDICLLQFGSAVFRTTAEFRDPSAWQHFVIALDTSNAPSTPVRVYINGEEIPTADLNIGTEVTISQNASLGINAAGSYAIGAKVGGSAFYDGYFADIHFCDGLQLDHTSFGETDATTGQWVPKEYTGSYGTNGFYLAMDPTESDPFGHDSSGNGNDWTENNLVDDVVSAPGIDFDGNDNIVFPGTTFTGDCTIECFVKSSDYSGNQRIFSAQEGTNSGENTNLRVYNGAHEFYFGTGSSVSDSGTTMPVNVWNHIALTRSGSTVSYYMNGTRLGTDTYSGSVLCTSMVLAHGYGSEYFTGQISNARIVNGQALYTGASYTVPTGPLTTTSQGAIATNVTHLLANTSTLTANGGTGSDGTAGGDPTAITAANPFGDPADSDLLADVPGAPYDNSLNGGGNYCTLNPLAQSGDYSNGNLQVATSNNTNPGTIAVSSGKWYYEATVITANSTNELIIGIIDPSQVSGSTYVGYTALGWGYCNNGNYYNSDSNTTPFSAYTDGDVIGVAFDLDANTLTFYKNNTAQTAQTITAGTYTPAVSGAGTTSDGTVAVNFGQRAFSSTPPTGFKALNAFSLPEPTIVKPNTVFDAKTYTGDGSTQSITGLGFSPDLTWIKSRSATYDHAWFDAVRGSLKRLRSNRTNSEDTDTTTLTSFNSDGFTTGDDDVTNKNNDAYISWNWDGGSSTVSNTDGSITSSVRANPTAGFSCITYTGAGSNATIGHGLGQAPAFIVAKNRTNAAGPWYVYHQSVGYTDYLKLSDASAASTYAIWPAAPTSTVFTGGSDSVMMASDYVAYAWSEVESYSKFGSFTGNNSSDGPCVALSFRPAWVMIKATSFSEHWYIYDTKRQAFNVNQIPLLANGSEGGLAYEGTTSSGQAIDMLSNGFKIRGAWLTNNPSQNYIYAAFAESPFRYANAR